jgi:hypothetical protein
LGEPPAIQRLSAALGIQVQPYSISLGQVDGNPNDLNWFDIRVGPVIIQRLDSYNVHSVFRNQQRELVIDFVSRFERILQSVIQEIDGGKH